jgi:hypothetical protein
MADHPIAIAVRQKLEQAGIHFQADPAPQGATRYGLVCMVEAPGVDAETNSDAIVANVLATTGAEGQFRIEFQATTQNGVLALHTNVWHWIQEAEAIVA